MHLYMNVPVGFHIDDLDAEHSAIEHKVAGLIKDDVSQSDAIHLLQFSLHSHSSPELHVGKLLSHLLQLCEHLTKQVWWGHQSETPPIVNRLAMTYC